MRHQVSTYRKSVDGGAWRHGIYLSRDQHELIATAAAAANMSVAEWLKNAGIAYALSGEVPRLTVVASPLPKTK